jgi:hypothetical protein
MDSAKLPQIILKISSTRSAECMLVDIRNWRGYNLLFYRNVGRECSVVEESLVVAGRRSAEGAVKEKLSFKAGHTGSHA